MILKLDLVGGIAGVFLGIAPTDNKLALIIYGGIVFLIAAYISKKIIKIFSVKIEVVDIGFGNMK